jgi:hypothetical protein
MNKHSFGSCGSAVSALVLVAMATPLFADSINPDFAPAASNGLERLEFRSNGNNTSWSIGLGSNTQQAGSFNQAGFDWQDDTSYEFSYAVSAAGEATFSLFDSGNPSALIALSWPDIGLGNALQVHAKRNVDVTFAGEDAIGDASNPFGADYAYIAIDPAAGFSLAGTINFRSPIANGSTSGVTITAGDLPAVPIPAAGWLFGSALVGMAGIGYRRGRRSL